jgi:hypothetical protein
VHRDFCTHAPSASSSKPEEERKATEAMYEKRRTQTIHAWKAEQSALLLIQQERKAQGEITFGQSWI